MAELGAGYLALIGVSYTLVRAKSRYSTSSLDAYAWKNLPETTNRTAHLASEKFGLRL